MNNPSHICQQSVFLDETAFTAFMNSDDAHYMNARSLFLELDDVDRKMVTTNYIIFDTHQWLRNQTGYKQAESFLNIMDKAVDRDKLDIIPGNSQLEEDAKHLLLERPEYQFSLSEAVTAIIIMTFQIKRVFTFNPKYLFLRELNSNIKLIPSVW